jgi:plasmid replication initiation protein
VLSPAIGKIFRLLGGRDKNALSSANRHGILLGRLRDVYRASVASAAVAVTSPQFIIILK